MTVLKETISEVEAPKIGEQSANSGNGAGTPTGGGDDGKEDWNNWPQDSRGPGERLSRYRLGLGMALVAIFMFFVAMSSAYIARQNTWHWKGETYARDWKPILMPSILWLNTLVLLLSSATMETARRHVFDEKRRMEEWLGLGNPTVRSSLPWLAISLLLGTAFIAGQLFAWNSLRSQTAYFESVSSHFFYLLTGAHAVHLLGGMIALLYALSISLLGRRLSSRQIVVDVTAWYWHGMGILWLGLFALMLLSR